MASLPPVSVLGTGWLGLPLLTDLAAAGYAVAGSYRRPGGAAAIRAAGGTPYFVDLPEPPPPDFLPAPGGWLIVTLPPGGRRLGAQAAADYVGKLTTLTSSLPEDVGLLYTSSTGVYGAATGRVDENTPPAPVTASARAVLAAERFLRELKPQTCILRLAGLVGPDRHPGRFYGGRERPVPDADAPINLVHREDVITAIRLVLAGDAPPGIYNVCAATHPPKGSYYTQAAKILDLTVAGTAPGGKYGKLIDSQRLRDHGWQPTRDNLDPNNM